MHCFSIMVSIVPRSVRLGSLPILCLFFICIGVIYFDLHLLNCCTSLNGFVLADLLLLISLSFCAGSIHPSPRITTSVPSLGLTCSRRWQDSTGLPASATHFGVVVTYSIRYLSRSVCSTSARVGQDCSISLRHSATWDQQEHWVWWLQTSPSYGTLPNFI